MIRFVQSDYARLRDYFDAYRFSPRLYEGSAVDVKKIHRNTLCAMQVWAAFGGQAADGGMVVGASRVQPGSLQAALIEEFFSDVVTSSFSAFHGLYKPASMTLRSAIEVFVRGIVGTTTPQALETKSVFKLFELAEASNIFAGNSASAYHLLKSEYGELCGYVHTATPGHMARVYAFADFPAADTARLVEFSRRHQAIIVSSLSIMIDLDKKMYTSVAPRARDLLDAVIPPKVRLRALGGG